MSSFELISGAVSGLALSSDEVGFAFTSAWSSTFSFLAFDVSVESSWVSTSDDWRFSFCSSLKLDELAWWSISLSFSSAVDCLSSVFSFSLPVSTLLSDECLSDALGVPCSSSFAWFSSIGGLNSVFSEFSSSTLLLSSFFSWLSLFWFDSGIFSVFISSVEFSCLIGGCWDLDSTFVGVLSYHC